MQHLSTVAWIPVQPPVVDWELRRSGYERARDAILTAVSPALQLVDPSISVVCATSGVPSRATKLWLQERSLVLPLNFYEFIRIESIVSIDVDELRLQNVGKSIDQKLVRAIAAMRAKDALEILLLLTELAEPGALNTTQGLVTARFGGAAFIRPKSAFYELDDSTESVAEKWPKLSRLDLQAICQWATRTSLYSDDLAATRLERSLAAFTQMVVLTQHRDGEVLFRAMQGLEAFYCDGVGDLRKQLSDKVALWLGRWQDTKNIVGRLYDLRSKFIHGSAKLEYATPHSSARKEDEQAMKEFDEGVTFAARLLTATLQECIRRNITDVRWSYAYATDA